MGRLALLLVVAAMLALGVSCGGDTPEPQPTPTSSRAERVQEQEQNVSQQEVGASEQQQGVAESEARPPNRRAGATMVRNVVGDPDAPVLIVEYSDFQ